MGEHLNMLELDLTYCCLCDKLQRYTVKEESETYPVDGFDIPIMAKVCYCDTCGEQLWNQFYDDDNLRRAFQKRASIMNNDEIMSVLGELLREIALTENRGLDYYKKIQALVYATIKLR